MRTVVVEHKDGIAAYNANDVHRMDYNKKNRVLTVILYDGSSATYIMEGRREVEQAIGGLY